MFPCFSEKDLSEDCNSVSVEEVNSINAVPLANGFRFLFTKAEIPEKLKIAGVQPFPLKASAKTGTRAVPSSVIRQRGFSGSSVCRNPGEASGTA